MANIGFISLGCAKNQVDCERMMYRVQEAGHTVKSDVVGSDVVVINTCGFIDSAKSEAIDYILQTAALKADCLVMTPSAFTSAKSRTRRSIRLAIRGVPRLRRAIS